MLIGKKYFETHSPSVRSCAPLFPFLYCVFRIRLLEEGSVHTILMARGFASRSSQQVGVRLSDRTWFVFFCWGA